MTLEATVSIGWVNTVIGAAQRLSVTADQLLAEAGIPHSACELERWPIDDITRLWHAAERCTDDPGFGLKVGAEFSPMSISGVGFALQSAATLREAIVMVQRFQRLISDGGRFQVVAGNAATWLVYHPRQGQTFDGLVDDVRREKALQAVADSTSPLPEIAEALGFAEVSTFYRAFRRWTGMPPVRWRKQQYSG